MRLRLAFAVFALSGVVAAGCGGGGGDDGGTDSGARLTDSGSHDETDSGTDPEDAGVDPDDAGVDPDAGSGACPYAYCEDFDTLAPGSITNGMQVGPWKATVNGPSTQMKIDSVNAFAGGHALHVTMIGEKTTDAGLPSRATLNQHTADGGRLVVGNNLFGRAEIFFSDAGTSGFANGTHSWLFSSAGKKLDGGSSNINLGGGGAKVQYNYHSFSDGGEQSFQGGALTAGAWHCLQWELDGSGKTPADVGKVWIDGALALDLEQKPGWDFPTTWNTFDFGFNHYQVLHNPVDVYLDSFALDGKMIPCP